MISQFKGRYAFLSNFFPAKIVYEGEIYPTVEHAYQAAKTLNLRERMFIRFAKQAGSAKRLGKQVTLRPDWDEIKLPLMYELVRQKFTKDKLLAEKLLATGDEELIEGNWWGDAFWGVPLDPMYENLDHHPRGLNHLGKILMRVRGELRDANKIS